MTRSGARFGYLIETGQDRPERPFTVYQDVTGRQVVIPAGEYAWTRGVFEGNTNQSAPISASLFHRDRHLLRWGLSRVAAHHRGCAPARGCCRRWAGTATTSRCRAASFINDLVPVKVSYAFTSLASVQGLIQYNRQASTISSNIRLALLNRSGTGFFLVYNDRRDTSAFTPDELLGRSFIVKYTRLFDY